KEAPCYGSENSGITKNNTCTLVSSDFDKVLADSIVKRYLLSKLHQQFMALPQYHKSTVQPPQLTLGTFKLLDLLHDDSSAPCHLSPQNNIPDDYQQYSGQYG